MMINHVFNFYHFEIYMFRWNNDGDAKSVVVCNYSNEEEEPNALL